MFDLGAVELHTGPAPFATAPTDRPALSPLARVMIDEGLDTLCTLDHSTVRIDDPVLRRFFAGLDGRRDAKGMRALAGEVGFSDPLQWPGALDIALGKALITLP